MYRLQGDRTVLGRGDTRRHPRARRRHFARARRRRARGRQDVLVDLGSTNGTFCNGERVPRHELTDGDKISDRRLDHPEVHLPGSGRRALSEAAVRIGAARRAHLDVQPPLLRRPAEHRDAVRRPARQVPGAAVRRHRSLQEDQRRLTATRPATTCWPAVAREMIDHHPRRGRAGPLRRRGVRHHLPRDRAGGRAGLGERLRAAVERTRFEHDGQVIPVTISIGAAVVAQASASRRR